MPPLHLQPPPPPLITLLSLACMYMGVGTVGSASKLMDIHQDGSGRLFFAVALYAEGKVQVYTFD